MELDKLDDLLDLVFVKMEDHHLKSQFREKVEQALTELIDRKVAAARIEELKGAAGHNNSEYTSDYLEARIKELSKDRSEDEGS